MLQHDKPIRRADKKPDRQPQLQLARQGNLSSILVQRVYQDARQVTPSEVLHLQRTIGNRATLSLLKSRNSLPPPEKLAVSPHVNGRAPAIQRQIMDPQYDDEVFEIETEKRRFRVMDMQGRKIKKDDPRRQMLSNLYNRKRMDPAYDDEVFEIETEKRRNRLLDMRGRKISQDDPRRRMLTLHLQNRMRGQIETQEAQELGESGPVSGMRGFTGQLEGALERRRQLGALPQGTETDRLREERQKRLGLQDYHGGNQLRSGVESDLENKSKWIAEESEKAALERAKKKKEEEEKAEKERVNKAAEAKVKEKSAKLAKELTTARAYFGTEDEASEVTQFDAAVGNEEWVTAAGLIDQIETRSAHALNTAKERSRGLAPTLKNVRKFDKCHIPDKEFRTLISGYDQARTDRDWITIGRLVNSIQTLADQAIGFKTRLDEVKRRAALLDNEQQKKNMAEWIELHESFTWDQVLSSAHSVYEKGGIGYLEDRLLRYEGRASEAQAAEEEEKRKKQEGLIGANGKVIGEKKPTDFSGQEQIAINDALTHYDAGTVPALSHPNGMKWGDAYGNRDGALPGTAGAGGYKEYYVEKATGDPTYHGSRRFVIHNSTRRVYYTWTHYGDNGTPAFVRIR